MAITMHKYKSDHKSGVRAYITEKDRIKALFPPKDGEQYIYVYSNTRPGKEHVRKMKALAVQGSGLTTYINKNIRDDYEARLPAGNVVIID